MKQLKAKLCLLIGFCVLVLSSCNMYDGKRPSDYENSTWVAETENGVVFSIQVAEDRKTTGLIFINDEVINVDIYFDFGSGIAVERADKDGSEEMYIIKYGKCKFKPDKCTVTDIEWGEKDQQFSDIKKLVFAREDLT
ncbi:MAG: hypothetical protein LBO63_08275 [Oscillospiraceae bacterium]|nr:hypothetical protein [Oscillospiraceae bacterium]